ncbi:hypothetical protein TNCV_2423231 [Trichonephila clavipes]|nr:hypothetical protein TNCV_2423231 [Trichonephila clavipes]
MRSAYDKLTPLWKPDSDRHLLCGGGVQKKAAHVQSVRGGERYMSWRQRTDASDCSKRTKKRRKGGSTIPRDGIRGAEKGGKRSAEVGFEQYRLSQQIRWLRMHIHIEPSQRETELMSYEDERLGSMEGKPTLQMLGGKSFFVARSLKRDFRSSETKALKELSDGAMILDHVIVIHMQMTKQKVRRVLLTQHYKAALGLLAKDLIVLNHGGDEDDTRARSLQITTQTPIKSDWETLTLYCNEQI